MINSEEAAVLVPIVLDLARESERSFSVRLKEPCS